MDIHDVKADVITTLGLGHSGMMDLGGLARCDISHSLAAHRSRRERGRAIDGRVGGELAGRVTVDHDEADAAEIPYMSRTGWRRGRFTGRLGGVAALRCLRTVTRFAAPCHTLPLHQGMLVYALTGLSSRNPEMGTQRGSGLRQTRCS